MLPCMFDSKRSLLAIVAVASTVGCAASVHAADHRQTVTAATTRSSGGQVIPEYGADPVFARAAAKARESQRQYDKCAAKGKVSDLMPGNGRPINRIPGVTFYSPRWNDDGKQIKPARAVVHSGYKFCTFYRYFDVSNGPETTPTRYSQWPRSTRHAGNVYDFVDQHLVGSDYMPQQEGVMIAKPRKHR
jgi:hypothetical protein